MLSTVAVTSPQGIELFVRWGQLTALPHNAHAHFFGNLGKPLGALLRGKTWDRFQLVNGAAGIPQAPAAHFGHHYAAGRRQGAHNQSCLIPHAAGAVFVPFDPGDLG